MNLTRVLALVALAACARVTPKNAVAAPLIELRMAHQIAAPELQRVEHEGRTFYLETRSVFADNDLKLVEPSMRGDTMFLELYPTPEGSARLRQATGDNIGKHLALLVNSRVRSIPVIQSAIGTPEQSIQTWVRLEPDEVERIPERIRSRWPQP
jgi:preprotein translocase subunit SecD